MYMGCHGAAATLYKQPSLQLYFTFQLLPCLIFAGGWAGGEAALLQLREQLQREKSAKKTANQASSSSSSKVEMPAPKGGLAPIYLGYGKE